MKTRHKATLICALGLAIGAVAFGWQRVTGKSSITKSAVQATPQNSATNSAPQNADIPKHVAYGLFFGEMAAFKKKAEENERQGLDGSSLRRHHKLRAGLNDQQAQILDSIANDCNEAVIGLNERARKIINKDRARHPHGRLNEGEPLPLPPDELRTLEDQRTTTVLGAREKLRQAFGEKEFRRFDDFVQQDIASRTKAIPRNGKHQ